MPFYDVENPSDEMLNDLLSKEKIRKCPDCQVNPSEQHLDWCDVGRCTKCGGQRLGCDCEEGENDIWDGYWSGTKECFDKKYVALWIGNGKRYYTFDYNRWAVDKALGK